MTLIILEMLRETRQGNTTQQKEKQHNTTRPKQALCTCTLLPSSIPLQPVQSLADRYARRVKKEGSIPEVKDGEMRETSSEPEEASFVLQADALQVSVHGHLHV